ncbi:Pkinase-domain-containing protein [Panus rudis PR-1116 ss-1]|nr:Pkinase-domain-containing protein [Panus rudis PR-1116 ss-1]
MMQPPPDVMATDNAAADTQQTQQATQPEAGYMEPSVPEEQIWGSLIPCNPALRRIDFLKLKRTFRVGRNADPNVGNDIILSGMKISNQHCEITWDGVEHKDAVVRVSDFSSNGTYINNEKIGKGRHHILKNGNEIAFGSSTPQQNSQEDYRFVYRHLAGGPPDRGFYSRYQLAHELGKGSFATVMKAISKETGQSYAVKIIQSSKLRATTTSPGSGQQVPQSEMFAREITILEKLRHPHICGLKEVFFEDSTINLVLEYVPGGDLLDYIIRHNGLSERETRHLTYQICDAMAYIHGMGITHRDLKPENILLTTDNPPNVKVADFGLAKAVDSYTMLRTMCGTPAYLAPEVVSQEDHEGYFNVVDSWSVGVIVFCMLTCNSPFIDPSDIGADVKFKVRHRRIEWHLLDEIPNVVPENGPRRRKPSRTCKDFIQNLLEVRPELRMTLTDACNHAWLRPLNPNPGPEYHGPLITPAPEHSTNSTNTATEDSMDLDEDAPSQEQSQSNGQATQRAALRRRRQVVDEAAENGEELPQPSQEMMKHAAQEESKRYAESGLSRPNKRKSPLDFEGSLTPMPEDSEEVQEGAADLQDQSMAEPLQESPMMNTRAKRAKAPSQSPEPPKTKGARATKGAAARGKGANVNSEAPDEEAKPPRRSNRLATPQKARK